MSDSGYPPPPYPYGVHPGPPPPPPPPQRRSRLPLVLGILAAVLVIGTAVALPVVLTDDDPGALSGPVDLAEVEVFEDLPTTHTEEAVDYDTTPPAGGAHFPVWLECGVYDSPVPDELAVHDLEHGTFWFAYDADAVTDDQVQALADQLPENGIMAPYDDLASPVVVTVWERQLALTAPDDPRLALFLDEYAGGQTAPEPMASCAGGVTAEEIDEAMGIETF